MNQKKQKTAQLISLVIISCIIMAIIETVIEPTYAIKSTMKIVFFFIIPLVFIRKCNTAVLHNAFALSKSMISKLLILGLIIYVIIMAAFALTKGVFDYTALVASLSADQNVSPENFVWVAAYISFGNSLLEEFMFRLVSFLVLSEYTTKKVAYIFSSSMFAIYHIAMIGSAFPLPLIILSLIGLAAGGMIFNYVDDKNKTIYNSWFVHMFADFAIMTIWYIHI